MRRVFRNRTVGAILVLALVAAACGSGDSANDEPIVVSSFAFNESVVVAEIYAQVLEDIGGFTVERKMNLGNREVVKPALESGEIDIVPEYIGTIDSFLGGTPTGDAEATWEEAKSLWEADGVTLLAYAPAEDKNAYVVTAETAAEYGLVSVSDLAPVAGELIFGGPPECPEREFCLPGLEEVYGLVFAEFKPLDAAGPITVAALDSGDIDVGLLFSSQGIIAEKGWVLLIDDKGLNPAENMAPAVRTALLESHGENVRTLLEQVSARLTQEDLTEMNKRADIDQDDPAVIAEEWIASQDISLDN